MTNMGRARCAEPSCMAAPSFGAESTGRREFCAAHAKEGMTYRGRTNCRFQGCSVSACCGAEGSSKREFCSRHALEGMARLDGKGCVHPGCLFEASYGVQGGRSREFCARHAAEQKVATLPRNAPKRKACLEPGCGTSPSYGEEGTGRRDYCSSHARPRMTYRGRPTCRHPRCSLSACCGAEGSAKAEFCTQHALPGMSRIGRKNCIHAGCFMEASYSLPGRVQREVCRRHANLAGGGVARRVPSPTNHAANSRASGGGGGGGSGLGNKIGVTRAGTSGKATAVTDAAPATAGYDGTAIGGCPGGGLEYPYLPAGPEHAVWTEEESRHRRLPSISTNTSTIASPDSGEEPSSIGRNSRMALAEAAATSEAEAYAGQGRPHFSKFYGGAIIDPRGYARGGHDPSWVNAPRGDGVGATKRVREADALAFLPLPPSRYRSVGEDGSGGSSNVGDGSGGFYRSGSGGGGNGGGPSSAGVSRPAQSRPIYRTPRESSDKPPLLLTAQGWVEWDWGAARANASHATP